MSNIYIVHVPFAKHILFDNTLYLTDHFFERYTCHISFQGLILAMIGPTLLDLQQLMGTTTAKIAFAVSARSFGMFVGSFLFGGIFHRVNEWLSTTISYALVAASTVLIPWCVHSTWLAVLFAIQGIQLGFFDAGYTLL